MQRIAPGLQDSLLAIHDPGMNKRTVLIEIFLDLPVRMPGTAKVKKMFAVLGYIFSIASDYQVGRMAIQEYYLPVEAFGKTDIIGIEPCYNKPLLPLLIQHSVPGRSLCSPAPASGSRGSSKPRMTPNVLSEEPSSTIKSSKSAKTVPIPSDRFGNILSCIVSRHQDGKL